MRTRPGAARAVLVPYISSRLIVIGALAVTRHVFSVLHIERPLATQDGLLGWDAAWYRDIAGGGYHTVPVEGLRFFPLFPLLGRAVSWLPRASPDAGVVIVANLSALVLGFLIYEFVLRERHDERLAARAVWLLYLAPPAYVLVMGYAEGTFMVASTIMLFSLRARAWWIAAIAGFLAGLTRPVGVLLALPAAIEAAQQRDARAIVPTIAPVAGLMTFLLWANGRAPDFLYPLRTQQDPTRRGGWIDPFRAIGHAFNELFTGDRVSAGVHAVAALVFIGLLVVLMRRWPLSFTVYAGAALVVALSSKNLDSLERYGLAVVPFILAGADVVNDETRERIVFTLAAAGLATASILAFTGVMVP
jgi:hypothetical protein